MFHELKTYLTLGNRFGGIEHTTREGKETIVSTVLKKQKNELVIELSTEETDIQKVSKQLKNNLPVTLIINNDQVLSKKLYGTENDIFESVLKSFPNLTIDDFYYEILVEKEAQFVSICRKSYIDKVLSAYKEQGVSIINVSLGNNLASVVSKFIAPDYFYTSNAKIAQFKHYICEIDISLPQSSNYDINGLNASNTQLLSMAGALSQVINTGDTQGNLESVHEYLQTDYKLRRFNTLFLKIASVFILFILLINFFVFSHYYEAVSDLEEMALINETTENKILQLNETTIKKQKIVDDLLANSSSKSSYFIQTIINSLPETILLTELNYQPLNQLIKPEKPIKFEEGTILIEGESNNSAQFSQWLSTLESLTWVQGVEIIHYGSGSNRSSEFKINIALDDES